MARRNIYSGYYDQHAGTVLHNANTNSKKFRWLSKIIFRCFWTIHAVMYQNYFAMATIFAVVMLSFLIPDISKRIHDTSELSDVKKILDLMTREVRLAEAACLTDVNDICYLHNTMQDDATETSRVLHDFSLQTKGKMPSTRSEPVQVDNKVGFLRRILFPVKNTSRKEVAIMSYVYTDSFDDQHKFQNKNKLSVN